MLHFIKGAIAKSLKQVTYIPKLKSYTCKADIARQSWGNVNGQTCCVIGDLRYKNGSVDDKRRPYCE